MAKKLQLQIPEPCHENWNKMTPVDKGRFCDSCQKAVIDFTGMSDTQLVAFFKKSSTGSVCGRFYNDQLDRNLGVPGKRMPWLKYFLQIIVPAFLFTSKARSQGEPRLIGDTILIDTSMRSTKINDRDDAKADSNKLKKITGKLVDEKGVGLPYASVMIKGTRTGVVADIDGNFIISPVLDRSPATLIFSCVGFESREMILDTNKAVSLCNVGLVPMLTGMVGAVVVIGRVPKKKKEPIKLFQKIFKDTSFKFFKAYPNPVSVGGVLNLELNKSESGEYQSDLINQAGQVIHSETVVFETKKLINSLRVPMITTGVYFVRMKNKKSGKTQTEKIIVQ